MSLNIVQNKVYMFNIQYMNAARNQLKGSLALKTLGATALNHKIGENNFITGNQNI